MRDHTTLRRQGFLGLYGGHGGQEIHRRKGLKKGKQTLDQMGRTELFTEAPTFASVSVSIG